MSALQPPSGMDWEFLETEELTQSPPENPQEDLDRYVFVLPRKKAETGGWNIIDSYLEDYTHPYNTIPFPIDNNTTIQVSRYFFTDMGRIGNPDQFFINGWKVRAPIGSGAQKKDLLTSLIRFANGELERASACTKVWNHRPKMALCDEVKKDLQNNLELNPKGLLPMIRSNGFQKVVSQLSVQEGFLTCDIEGKIECGTDEETNILPLNVRFTANLTLSEAEGTVEFSIRYFPSEDDLERSEE